MTPDESRMDQCRQIAEMFPDGTIAWLLGRLAAAEATSEKDRIWGVGGWVRHFGCSGSEGQPYADHGLRYHEDTELTVRLATAEAERDRALKALARLDRLATELRSMQAARRRSQP